VTEVCLRDDRVVRREEGLRHGGRLLVVEAVGDDDHVPFVHGHDEMSLSVSLRNDEGAEIYWATLRIPCADARRQGFIMRCGDPMKSASRRLVIYAILQSGLVQAD